MATAPSLFGASPDMVRQQREEQIQAQGEAAAGRNINQQARYLQSVGASRFGDALGGLLGGQDPAMKEASLLKSLAQGLDFNKPEDMSTYAQRLNAQGLSAKSLQASQQAQAMRLQGAQVGKAQLDLDSKTDEFNKDKAFTTEIQKLGPDATEEQIVRVAVMYGTQDTVMKVVSRSSNQKAAIAAAVAAAQEKSEAKRVDEDRRSEDRRNTEDGKNQRNADNNQLRRDLADLKGPSISELKRLDAKEKEADGKTALGNTIENAQQLVKSLGDSGGMTSTTASALSNLITSGQTSRFGQAMGRATGTDNQKQRDVLASTKLQLLNDVAAATGMSSSRLNSNVELKTWLDSLGSVGSTVEANKEILEKISNRFLKTPLPAPPVNPSKPAATASSPKARAFASEAAVNAANLEKGTQITINGRRAVVE